jgi:hypothetical protein
MVRAWRPPEADVKRFSLLQGVAFMGFNYKLSEDAQIYPLSLVNGVAGATGNLNVQNGNVETVWVDVSAFDRISAYVQCDHASWHDTLTTLKLQQAQDSSGTGAKDLTTSAAGGNYDTSVDTLAAAGSFAILEARSADLDANNGFRYVRLYAASTGNTGADNLFGFLVVHEAEDKHRQLQGAYSAATAVYVTPQFASSANSN